MTVQAVARYTPIFTTDGIQTTFPYAFEIQDVSYLLVVQDGAILPAAAYSVTGVNNENGGTFIFNLAPASGSQVQAFGQTPYDQELEYPEGGTFPAASHESGLDREAMVTMEQRDILELVPQYPPWFPLVLRNQRLPTPVPLNLLGWDANGEAWVPYPSTIQTVTQGLVAGITHVKTETFVDAIAGETRLTATGAFPAGTEVLSALGDIVTNFGTSNGLATIALGDPDVGQDMWASTMGIATPAKSNTGQHTKPRPLYNAAPRDVIVTAITGGPFDAVGRIRISTWSLLTIPT